MKRARLDPAVPIEDTIGAIADMVKAGYVKHIGLSEVGAETIRRAAMVHPIVDLPGTKPACASSQTLQPRAGVRRPSSPSVGPPGSIAGDRYPSLHMAHLDSER